MPLSVDSKVLVFEGFLVKDEPFWSDDDSSGELPWAMLEFFPSILLGLGSAVVVRECSFPLPEISGSSLLGIASNLGELISGSILPEIASILGDPIRPKMLEPDCCKYQNIRLKMLEPDCCKYQNMKKDPKRIRKMTSAENK